MGNEDNLLRKVFQLLPLFPQQILQKSSLYIIDVAYPFSEVGVCNILEFPDVYPQCQGYRKLWGKIGFSDFINNLVFQADVLQNHQVCAKD